MCRAHCAVIFAIAQLSCCMCHHVFYFGMNLISAEIRVFWLSVSEEIMTLIAFFILIKYLSVSDRQTDGQTGGHLRSSNTSACIACYAKTAPVKIRVPTCPRSGHVLITYLGYIYAADALVALYVRCADVIQRVISSKIRPRGGYRHVQHVIRRWFDPTLVNSWVFEGGLVLGSLP